MIRFLTGYQKALAAIFIFAVIVILLLAYINRSGSDQNSIAVLYRETPTPLPTGETSATETAASPITSPTPAPTPAQVEPSPQSAPDSQAVVISSESIIIPVVGVKAEQLQDTFKDSRSQNRVHDAIDIMAPRGAAVVAAVDGKIAKFFDSEKGGITIYQFGRDEKTVYYYAHLDRRAETLREGETVKQGTVIGYVGDTGNSGAGNYHLHFAIWTVDDPKRYWDGTNINPYPLLR